MDSMENPQVPVEHIIIPKEVHHKHHRHIKFFKTTTVILSILVILVGIIGIIIGYATNAKLATAVEIIKATQEKKLKEAKKALNPLTVKQYIKTMRPSLNADEINLIIYTIYEAADYYKLSPELLLFIMDAESDFNPKAVSNKGAMGIMQVNPRVWERQLIENKIIKTRKDLFNIRNNIYAGAFILKTYLTETKGDMALTIRKYFGGDGRDYLIKIKQTVGNFWVYAQNITTIGEFAPAVEIK